MGFADRNYSQRKDNKRYKSRDKFRRPQLQRCPLCGEKSLFWNIYDNRYECLNHKCGAVGPSLDALWVAKKQPEVVVASASWDRFRASTGRVLKAFWRQVRRKLTPFRIKRIFKTLWNIFKRMLVFVVVLAATAIVVAAVCRIITGSARLSIGIAFAIVGIGLLAWGVKSVTLRRLSFARTFMLVLILGLFVLASSAYLDVRSPADIKDSIIAALRTDSEQFRTSVDAVAGRAELKIVEVVSSSDEKTEKESEEITEKSKETEHVHIDGGVVAGANGHWITLCNNPNAKNPTWDELKAFLAEDRTDEHPYELSTFVCADFAEMLHNNAEAASIRAAYFCVWLGPCSYFPSGGGHCLNAFETTDQGLVYIDCTGALGSNSGNCDKIVDVSVDKHYIPRSIFPKPGWRVRWGDMGIVEEIEVVQW